MGECINLFVTKVPQPTGDGRPLFWEEDWLRLKGWIGEEFPITPRHVRNITEAVGSSTHKGGWRGETDWVVVKQNEIELTPCRAPT